MKIGRKLFLFNKSRNFLVEIFSTFSIDESSSSANISSPLASKSSSVDASNVPPVPKTFPFEQQISTLSSFLNGANADYVNTRFVLIRFATVPTS